MSTELQLLNGQGIAELKEMLPTLQVTKRNYVLAVNLKSFTNSKAFTDWLASGFEHVSNCVDCEELHEDGFGIKLITTTKRVWKESKSTKARQKEIDALKLQLKNLEIDQKADYEKNGFIEEEGTAYYKAI